MILFIFVIFSVNLLNIDVKSRVKENITSIAIFLNCKYLADNPCLFSKSFSQSVEH